MSLLWICPGWAYLFFLSFNPLAPNYCFLYNFYDSEMFFRPVVSMGPRRHCFFTRTRDFSFCHGHAQDKTKKFHNYNDTFVFNFYNIGLENLVLDQLTISLSMLFFIPITFWLDFVRRNSVSVTHKSERVISHCNWTEITHRSKKSSISINNTPSSFWKILKQLV